MSGYSQGRDVEWAVIHDLTDNGYECTRAASSKGVADVIAMKPGQLLLVNVKRTTPPGPTERTNLLRVAGYVPQTVPLVALKPARCPIEYRLLTGPGPSQWQPWTPDELDTIRTQPRGEAMSGERCKHTWPQIGGGWHLCVMPAGHGGAHIDNRLDQSPAITPAAAPEPRSTPGPSTDTPEPSQAASEACSGEVARLREALEQVQALFAGGPDTSCRTTWHDGPFSTRIECVEVPMDDLRGVLDSVGAVLASVDAPAPFPWDAPWPPHDPANPSESVVEQRVDAPAPDEPPVSFLGDDTLRDAIATAIGGRLVLRPSMTEVAGDVLAVLREKGALR